MEQVKEKGNGGRRRKLARAGRALLGAAIVLGAGGSAQAQSPIPTILNSSAFQIFPVEIVNVNSNKCLHAEGTAPSSRAVQFNCNGTPGQLWSTNALYDTDHHIRAGNIGGTFLSIIDDIRSPEFDAVILNGGSASWIWQFAVWSDGSYRIRNKNSGLCLGVRQASTADNAPVRQYACDTSNAQRWRLRPRYFIPFQVMAMHSEKCLTVAEGSDAVRQHTCSSGNVFKQFRLEHVGVLPGLAPADIYLLKNPEKDNCLGILGSSTADGARIVNQTCGGTNFQKWLIASGPDYVLISNLGSGKCMAVSGGSTATGTGVVQSPCTAAGTRWWWANFASRHIHFVTVARGNGSDPATATDAVIQQHVAKANSAYRRYGTELLFDPATDRSSVSNEMLYQLNSKDDSGIGVCPDGSAGSPQNCARRYASQWPGKVVVISRRGGSANGFTSGDFNYIVLGHLVAGTVCGGTVPNTQWLAHEFGHYMGLIHTWKTLWSSIPEAVNAWAASGYNNRIFDGDDLLATPTDPAISTLECLAPSAPTGVVPLYDLNLIPRNFVVATDNVLSYYYNVAPRITGRQADIVRGTSLARGF